MADFLSPGVSFSERDLTSIIPAVATSIGATAGHFNWGPIDEITTISNEVQLISRFSTPDSANVSSYTTFFSAANFLAYSNNLKVIRSGASGLKNSTSNTTTGAATILVKNDIDYMNYSNGNFLAANTYGPFIAKYAGSKGNSLRYSICDANSISFASWVYANNFPSVPGTSDYVASQAGANDELHIIVLDTLGKFTGVANTVLEKFSYVSRAVDCSSVDGSSMYYKDVVNRDSKYLRWFAIPSPTQLSGNIANATGSTTSTIYSGFAAGSRFVPSTAVFTTNMAGGADGIPSSSNLVTSYALLNNADEVDVGLIFTGTYDATVIASLQTLAEARKDTMVFLSPKMSDVVNNYGNELGAVRSTRGSISSSYLFMDSGYKYQYDKYNDQYVWIPTNADVAGLCAKTDADRDPWFSPGGLNRGFIKNLVKLAYNPTKTDRDSLYNAQINPIVTFSGEGTVLFGDKTFQIKPSAFDRINVRRLFIVLEKAIAKAAKYSLFEFNDAFTRAQFVSLIEPYLRDIQGRRGITDFRVVCNETNNTSEVVDRNQFVGDIYIKPTRSINFIQLNFVAARSGVSFDELVGKF